MNAPAKPLRVDFPAYLAKRSAALALTLKWGASGRELNPVLTKIMQLLQEVH